MTVLDYALAYLRGGISVVPIARDGLKVPDTSHLPREWDGNQGRTVGRWKPFQKEPVEEGLARKWWGSANPPGIAAVCGTVSRCLEVIDFDREADIIFPQWRDLVEADCPGLMARLCVHRTPRNPAGMHAAYRCGDIEIPGNQKLAEVSKEEEPNSKKRILIETRGEGGYFVLPGSPPECHENSAPYEHVSGPHLWDVGDVSIDERETLLAYARYFDRSRVPLPPPIKVSSGVDLRPGEDFDARGWDWAEILCPKGWVLSGQFGKERRWRRPGKDQGWSATTGHCVGKDGSDLFRVFSTDAHPFEPLAYGKFRTFALLYHNGDLARAASDLAKKGFGSRRTTHTSNGHAPTAPATPTPAAVVPVQVPAYEPFPLDFLPRPLRLFVTAGAEALHCDPAYIALPALAVCASAIGNSRELSIKRSWSEPTTLWTVVVGHSGTLKTPAYKLAMKPLYHAQRKWRKDFRTSLHEYEDKLDWWKDKAKAARKEGGEPPPEPRKPTMRRAYCSDVTIERLAEILEDNPRGVLVTRDELKAWFNSFCRYKTSGSSDVPNWLELYQAGNLAVDRKTGERQVVMVDRASACVTGGIQPGTLARALTEEHVENGLASRLLPAYPPRRPKVWTEAEIDQEIELGYAGMVNRLLDLKMRQGAEGELEPCRISLCRESRELWVEFYNEWAQVQHDAEGEVAAAYSKIEGATARLALLHHVVTMLDMGSDDTCDLMPASMESGIVLGRWFAREADRIYAVLRESDEQRQTRHLVEWITTRGGKVSVKQLQRSNSRRYPSKDAAEGALHGLVQIGLGRWDDPLPPGPKGGRPSKVFSLLVSLPTIDDTDETSDEGN